MKGASHLLPRSISEDILVVCKHPNAQKHRVSSQRSTAMKERVFSLVVLVICLSLLLTLAATGQTPEAQGTSSQVSAAPQASSVELGLVGQLGGGIYAVAVQGNYAYVGEGPRLTILDISNPASPTVVGKTDPLPDIVEGVAVARDYAYVADGSSGLRVVDVSTPSNPTEVGFYDTPGYAHGVTVAGGYAYVADWDEGLRVMDVSDPANPAEVGFYDTPGWAEGVVVAGDYAYIAEDVGDGDGMLRVVDVSMPSNPTEVGFYDTPGSAYGVAIAGGYAYVADGSSGLRVVDVSTPSNPTEVGSYDTPSRAEGVAVAEGYAYIANGGAGLRVVDVSTPSNPTEVGFYDTPGHAHGVAVSGSYAYIADGYGGGLRVIDVADPAHPEGAGYWKNYGVDATGVAVAGNYAYVGDSELGLWVIDVSDCTNPQLVGHLVPDPWWWGVWAVSVAGSHAYVAGGDMGLRVVDVSDSSNPTEVGFYDTPGYAKGVAIAGGYAYVADWDEGLRVVDVSDPANPTEVGYYDTPGQALGVAVAGGYAYVADGDGGLFILRYTGGGPALPGSGALVLSAPATFLVDEALAGTVWVHNSSAQAQAYTTIVRLRKDGATVGSRVDALTVPAGGTDWRAFDFGVQEAGSYRLVAELRTDDALLQTVSKDIDVVLSVEHRQAQLAARQLTRSALWEFQQAQEIVVWAYGESVTALPGEAVNFIVGDLLDLITPVGEAALVPHSELSQAGYEVAAKVCALDEVLGATSRPAVERVAREMTDAHLSSARQQVESRRQQFDDYVLSRDVSWSREMWNLTDRYIEVLESRVEQERFGGFAPPPVFMSWTTLSGEELTFRVYQGIGMFLGWLGILAAIAVMIWAIVGTLGGSIPAVVVALARLGHLISGLKHAAAVLLVLLSMVMDFQTEHILGPRITGYHDRGLDELESLIGAVGAMRSADVETRVTQVEVLGSTVSLVSTVTNTDNQAAQPVLQTDMYSADGRLVEVLVERPRLTAQGTAVLRGQLDLPPGGYRAVTVVHSQERLGLASDVSLFAVARPQVSLALHIAQPQLAVSQTLQAGVDITNTDTTTGTGELGLLIASSDGENVKVKQLSLAAGAVHHTDFSFVPPAEGSYVLRAVVIDEQGDELAAREVGYVVGSGPALGIDVGYQPEYNPGVDVSASITATNTGNQAASSMLALVTIDQETTQAVHTQTLSLDLPPGGTHDQGVIVLPNAQPGQYQVNLLLDGASHRTFSFLVAAEDRLWATVSADPTSMDPSRSVTITVQVANATYTDTDASVSVSVVDPVFADHAVTVTRVATGTYRATYTPVLSGTYQVNARAEKPNWRGSEAQATFTVGQPGVLLPTIGGTLQAGQTGPLTVTVRNEWGLPVPMASVILSGTNELLYRETDTDGAAIFYASPCAAAPYRVTIQKMGYADTSMTLEVEPFGVYLPLILRDY